ncbi:MAG TPA: Ldh family oxidoreductase [Caldilineaceae bacterium]|nr:Ldh family oxidoreductase [Caldilineaceae bacterium]
MNYTAQIQADALETFTRTLFEKLGIPAVQAADAAAVLLYASRRGVETHGVRNVKPIYHRQITNGIINLSPTFKLDHETPVSARVDGDAGLGLVTGPWAMRLAMQKAQTNGIGMVTVHNSYHYGAAGYYPWMALQEDLIGISMTGRFYSEGAEYGVLPTYGAKAMFSTNPIAVSFPTAQEPPWLFDMATSVVPFNRVTMLRDNGLQVPLGWGVTEEGEATTDPSLVRALFPLGGERPTGGHKGYGLMMMVSVLCNVLSGGWDGGMAGQSMGFNNDGHFFAAMRVDLFRPLDEFKAAMDDMIRALHDAPKAKGHDRIYVAGEIEHETEQLRLQHGIPLTDYVANELQALGEEYGVAFPVEPISAEAAAATKDAYR